MYVYICINYLSGTTLSSLSLARNKRKPTASVR